MRRRDLLVLAAAALAAPVSALADDQKMPLSKAFPMLEQYLGVPPGERSRFYLVYRATRDKRPTSDARAAIVGAGGAAVPLGLDRAGVVTRLPTMAELKGPAQFIVEGAPFKLGVELRGAIAPSTHVDAAEITAALAQVNAAVAKIAGALAMMVPKMTTAFFPGSGGGHALFADGHQAPLPVYASPLIGSTPFFEPAKTAGAKAVLLARAPSRILLGAHPKGV
jgi:prepilin-type processing-associated H-X9-DG protein